MKQSIIYLLWLLIPTVTHAQKFDGSWLGKLSIAGDLRVVFNISRDGTTYKADMDSPDQGAKGLPVSEIKVIDDSLYLGLDILKGKFTGKLINDTTLAGTLEQHNMQMPLTLYKTKKYAGISRPQTPKHPYPYTSVDVEYDNENKTVHLGATLTYPTGNGKYPAAILITGSGQQDRDETIMEHKPFAVIADYLTKMGMAVLRVDDRGTGKSKGEVFNATSQDFANDVETSLQFLKQQKNIDTTRIGLIGHSEGGLIASMVASRNKRIDYIILLAGPGVKGAELLAQQNEAILIGQNLKKEVANDYAAFYLDIANAVIKANNDDTAQIVAMSVFEKWKKNTTQLNLETLGFAERNSAETRIKELVKAFRKPWMKFFLTANPQTFLEKVNAKVLALNGEKDIQVLAGPNIEGIKKAFVNNKSVVLETRIIPQLNHLFQHCKTCTVSEYGKIEETISPEVLQIMGDWLKKEVVH